MIANGFRRIALAHDLLPAASAARSQPAEPAAAQSCPAPQAEPARPLGN